MIQRLYAKLGEWRVRDTPISKNSYTGLAVGVALVSGRTVVEIMTVNFALLALDAIINVAAKIRCMPGGQFRVPVTIRMPGGVAKQLAAQHSQRRVHTLMNVLGLRIVAPATPQDAYWQLSQAIRHDDPVFVLEHELLYFTQGPFDISLQAPPLHQAAVRRAGTDVTLIAWPRLVEVALDAANLLEQDGIVAGVIDLRSLPPRPGHAARLDYENAPRRRGGGGLGRSRDRRAARRGGVHRSRSPSRRIAAADVPTPNNGQLEQRPYPRRTRSPRTSAVCCAGDRSPHVRLSTVLFARPLVLFCENYLGRIRRLS